MEKLNTRGLDKLWIFFAPLFVLFLGLDQISKEWAVSNLKTYESDDFGFALTQNYGLVFGLDMPLWLIYGLTFAILGLGVSLVVKEKLWRNHWHLFSIALIAAGAIGNVTDRVRFGYVIDFIKVYWWPTFNLADVWIVSGVILLAWSVMFREKMVEKL